MKVAEAEAIRVLAYYLPESMRFGSEDVVDRDQGDEIADHFRKDHQIDRGKKCGDAGNANLHQLGGSFGGANEVCPRKLFWRVCVFHGGLMGEVG